MDEEGSREQPGSEDASDAVDGDEASAADDHALAPEDLQYPEYVFESGEMGDQGGFDLQADLDREDLRDWVEDLAGGLRSHDVAVETPDGYVTLGVAPEGAALSFDPDESGVGSFEFTVEMRAKAMFVADDPDGAKVGARGGTGFIPVEQLTTDREDFRCYNWMGDDSGGDDTSDAATDGDSDDGASADGR